MFIDNLNRKWKQIDEDDPVLDRATWVFSPSETTKVQPGAIRCLFLPAKKALAMLPVEDWLPDGVGKVHVVDYGNGEDDDLGEAHWCKRWVAFVRDAGAWYEIADYDGCRGYLARKAEYREILALRRHACMRGIIAR